MSESKKWPTVHATAAARAPAAQARSSQRGHRVHITLMQLQDSLEFAANLRRDLI